MRPAFKYLNVFHENIELLFSIFLERAQLDSLACSQPIKDQKKEVFNT